MTRYVIPLTIAVLPLIGLSALQFSFSVVAPLMMQAMGQPAEAYGLLAGTIGLGSVWFYVASHAVTPALGPVRTLRYGLWLATAGTLCMVFGRGPVIYVGALMFGFAYGTTTPAGSQVLAEFTPKALWGTLFSIRQAGVPLGGMIAGLATTALSAAYGWQIALLGLVAVVGVLGAGFSLVPRAYNSGRPLVPFRPLDFVAPSNLLRPMRYLRRVPGLTSLTMAACGFAAMHATVVSFFVTYLYVGLGIPLTTAGALYALLQAFAIIGRILFGYIADRFASPLAVLKVQAPLSAAATLLLATFSARWPMPLMALASAMVGLTVGTWNGLFLAQVARTAPEGEVSEATAASGAVVFLTYMVVPPAFGLAAALLGYDTALILFAFAPLFAYAVLIDRVEAPAV
jgi:MFS family permease